jgi:hypothetical protein
MTRFCKNCAYLVIMPDATPPKCLATAHYVKGPIRSRIDVVGMVSAEYRNIGNDCRYWTPFSPRSVAMKRWLLWRLKDAVEDTQGFRKVTEYPIEAEYRTKRRYEKDSSDRPETVSESESVRWEAVFDGGGDDGDDESGIADQVGDEDVSDS